MKYTIDDIQVNQIKVTFEDGSWALVPVTSEMSTIQIDDAVAKYDPDNLPKVVNQNISPGEERTSVIFTTPEPNFIPAPAPLPLYNLSQPLSGYESLARYFEEKGDPSLKEWLNSRIEKQLEEWGNIAPEQIINAQEAKDSSDKENDIFTLAQNELS
jgi:hypothetical protein